MPLAGPWLPNLTQTFSGSKCSWLVGWREYIWQTTASCPIDEQITPPIMPRNTAQLWTWLVYQWACFVIRVATETIIFAAPFFLLLCSFIFFPLWNGYFFLIVEENINPYWLIRPIQNDAENLNIMTETLAHGYSSESTRELSNENQYDGVF